MYVLLIQPPVSPLAEASQPPREPPVPPWDLVGLHSYLLSRTGHQSILFDARVHPQWPSTLEHVLPYDSQQLVVVARVRAFELPAALHMLRAVKKLAPQAMRVLCGPLPTIRPAACARLPEVDAVIAGDPELTLRALLENRYARGRLCQIPGLALHGQTTTPTWAPDLQFLPPPAWERLPWKDYTRFAQSGLRALVRVSRGHTGEKADRALGGTGEPIRYADVDRLATSFGKCAHLGVVETLVVDPPGLWTTDRLQTWCSALQTARNTHPWSLQLLPHLLSSAETAQLAQAACRRVEFILPSARPEELSRYGVRGEPRALQAAVHAVAGAGLEVLLRCWVGGPGEEHNERRRWLKVMRQLGYPPVRFQPFPLALDAPMLSKTGPSPHIPDLDTWIEQSGQLSPPVSAWDGALGQTRALALCDDLESVMRQGWSPRIYRFWNPWRETSTVGQWEPRGTG